MASVYKSLELVETIPVLIETPKEYIEVFSRHVMQVLSSQVVEDWAKASIIEDSDPEFLAKLAVAVEEGNRVILIVRDGTLASSPLSVIRYAQPSDNIMLPIHRGFVKLNPKFRICCILQKGISSWADDWRNRMRDNWIYNLVKPEDMELPEPKQNNKYSQTNILVEIPKESVEDLDVMVFTKRLERWKIEYGGKAKSAGIPVSHLLRGTVIMSIKGYDDDPRYLFEIPEVKQWYRELLKTVPYLFYYIDPNPAYHQYFIILPMFVKYTRVSDEIVLDPQSLKTFLVTALENVQTYAERIGDNPHKALNMILEHMGIR